MTDQFWCGNIACFNVTKVQAQYVLLKIFSTVWCFRCLIFVDALAPFLQNITRICFLTECTSVVILWQFPHTIFFLQNKQSCWWDVSLWQKFNVLFLPIYWLYVCMIVPGKWTWRADFPDSERAEEFYPSPSSSWFPGKAPGVWTEIHCHKKWISI